MSIKSKLAVIAALTTLVAAPAFAIDQQASTEAALDNPGVYGAHASSQPIAPGFNGAYASARSGNVRNQTVDQPTLDFSGIPAAR
jgi:hypothetical protein